jgi:ADP-ribose pyrophosphatase
VSPEEPGRLARREIYSGRIVRLSVDRVRFPGGSTGELELVRHPGAAAVLPFLDPPSDPDPRVLLVHQYRYAADGHLYEVPAGMPHDPGESWEGCARRELAEETGYRAGDLRYLTRILTTPGFTDETIHLFAAAGLEAGETSLDHDEFLRVVPMPFSRAVEGVRTGEIVDAKSVATLLYADRFLPERWMENAAPPPR